MPAEPLLSRDDVIAGYRLILGREPESEAAIEVHRPLGTIANLRAALLASPEFLGQFTAHHALFPRDKWVKTEIRGGLAMWVNLRDAFVSRGCLADDYEPAETRFILSRLRRGDVFVDIGANIGWFTLLAARQVGRQGPAKRWLAAKAAAGRVIAFEPRSDIFAMLQRSVAENGLSDCVTLHRAALADRDGAMDLVWHKASTNPRGTHLAPDGAPRDAERESVRVTTLDGVDIPQPIAVIKVDAEGAELLIFRGAVETLRRSRPMILAEIGVPQLAAVSRVGADEFIGQMGALGYACHKLTTDGDIGATLSSSRQLERKTSNVVFVPR